MTEKKCGKCKQVKPVAAFSKALGNRDGLQTSCKVCQVEAQTQLRRRRAAQRLAQTPPAEFEITVTDPVTEPALVLAAQPVEPPKPPEVSKPETQTREQLQIARLKQDKTRLAQQVRELERLALSGDAVRDLLGTLGAPNVIPDPEWLRGASDQRSVTGTAVLFLSDIHFDEVVSAAQVGGSNEYNREIAIASIRNTFRSAIMLLKGFMAAPKYDGIVCPLGGDLLSGNIHEELQQTNEAPIQQSMIVLEEILIEGLGALADEFGKVHVPCVVGNHGRMTRKPQAKNRALESFEWPIYQRLAAHFRKDSRLTFDIPDGPDAFFNIYGTRFCLTHGDQFRGGDGVGGILVPIGRGLSRKQFRQQAMGDPFDVMMIGHWHQYIHLSNLIINGSIKGMDEYAYQGNFAFQEPEQALFIVHPEIGVTARWPIKCRVVGGKVKSSPDPLKVTK